MTSDLIARARAGDGEAFRELTEPHRRELQVHCYRMLGCLQDAEDLLQDTLLAAWQGLESFEERASIRTWLYRIATNRCLNALRSISRRPAKEWDIPRVDPPEPSRLGEVVWLEPYPDALLEGIDLRLRWARSALSADRSHLAGLHHRAATVAGASACRVDSARGARISRRRSRRHARDDGRLDQQRAQTRTRQPPARHAARRATRRAVDTRSRTAAASLLRLPFRIHTPSVRSSRSSCVRGSPVMSTRWLRCSRPM